jgi:hypothetical protein
LAHRTYICLFDLPAYDKRVAPALRRYQTQYDPAVVVALLRDISKTLPGQDDCQHWIDAIEPDAGHKPSDQTIHELAGMLIQNVCFPHGLGVSPMQEIERFVPYLSERSEWFADLEEDGEELAGGRLEFTFGSGSLIATREQIHQFLEEVRRVPPPPGQLAVDYGNLRKLLTVADTKPDYTLLKTSLAAQEN